MVWGESDSMPPQVSSERRIRTKILEFIAIPKTMKVKVEILPNKRSKQETNYWTDHHKKNCDKDSGVHRNCPKTMKVKVKVKILPKKMGTRNKSQHRTDHHKKNYKTNSGLYCRSVSRNYLQSESNWDCSLYSTTFVVEQTSFFLQLLVCFLWFIFLNTKLCYKNAAIEDWKPCYLPGCGQ